MRSYGLARALFSLMGLIATCLIVFGLSVAYLGGQLAFAYWPFDSNTRWVAPIFGSIPGFWLAMYGLLGLAAIQDARATVDTAEYTQQMLQVARNHLDVSQRALRQGEILERGFEALRSRGEGQTPSASYGDRPADAAPNAAAIRDEPALRASAREDGAEARSIADQRRRERLEASPYPGAETSIGSVAAALSAQEDAAYRRREVPPAPATKGLPGVRR